MIVFLSGLSGVGKTTTAQAFVVRHTQFRHVIASHLIRRAGASTQKLDYSQVKQNQIILLREFAAIRNSFSNCHILLDGHMIIEINEGEFIVDDNVINGLSVTHFIALIDNPNRVYSTKRNARKFSLSPNELERLQRLEVTETRRQAERTGCPFFQIRSGEIKSLEDSLGFSC
jgi:adenylate kinase